MPVYVWYPIMIGLTVGFSFMSIPPLTAQFMELFNVGYGGLALFLSGLLWSHSLLQIPSGLLIDRFGSYRCVMWSCILGVAANLIPFAEARNLGLAIAGRFILGMCTGLIFLCMVKIIAILAPALDMAKAQGYYGGSFGLGTMLPYFVLPYFGEQAWKYSYSLNAGMYALSFFCLLLLPRQALGPVEVTDKPSFRHVLSYVLRCPEIWALGLLHGVTYGTLNNLGQWFPSMLADISGKTASQWALAATLVLFLGACSRFFSGLYLKILPRRTLLFLVSVAVFVLYSALATTHSPFVTLGAGVALAIVSGMNYGTVFSMTSLAVPSAFSGTALGFMNSIANLINICITLLLGNARELSGGFGGGMVVVGIGALATWFAIYRIVFDFDKSLP